MVRYYNNNYKGVDQVDQYISSLKYPGRCKRWTTRMFIYFMQTILVNSFSLFRLKHPEHKNLSLIPFVNGLIDQLYINLKQKIQITPKRHIEESISEPVVTPVQHAYGHEKEVQKSYLKCSYCQQSWTRNKCSCEHIAICDLCRVDHIKQTNIIRCYNVHKPGK
ncbi:Transposase_IS4 [Hexamita inflata]|uniref:Transposase IS4 n=1 Tax=Hexamita inflata TaxID=28002 RepID=A0AA86TT71_9EUKA|nr:Transposase IS4 [Hexamita inflata]